MKINTTFILVLLALISLPCMALNPIDFFKKSKFDSIKISPTGEYLAATVPVSDRTVLVILQASDLKVLGVFRPEEKEYVDSFTWSSNIRVIFNTSIKIGNLEEPYAMPGLWGMDFDGKKIKKFSEMGWPLNTLPDDEDNVLIDHYDSLGRSTYGLQNTYTGKVTSSKQVAPSAKDNFEGLGFYATSKGEVLIHVAEKAGADKNVFYSRATLNDPWVQIFDENVKGGKLSFGGFSPSSKLAYFTLEDPVSGPDSLISIDLLSHEIKTVQRDDNVNPYAILESPIDGSVYAIEYLDGKPRFDYIQPDNEFAIEHKKMRKSFPNQIVEPVNYTKDGNTAIYYVWSDANPGDYYIYNRKSGEAKHLVSDRSWLNPELMANTEPVKFKARDGLELEAFLTMPRIKTKNVPLIVNPHGGPFGIFDQWGFDPEVQLLANKGYAVLQVNFRGSGNYGKTFEEKGYKQWGRTMQDDITDATKWVIEKGIATPGKICIYGSSYGGYAALMGAIREPDLYSCVIGYVGAYDLKKMYDYKSAGAHHSGSRAWYLKKFYLETIGSEGLEQVSPVFLANSIKAPVFLASGELDYNVPVIQTKDMHKALKTANKSVELKIYDKEGHGNFLLENQMDLASRVLQFLDKTIGPASVK
jgi:dipeptidyl aminopeptidase/acylaminoacyl peptidase